MSSDITTKICFQQFLKSDMTVAQSSGVDCDVTNKNQLDQHLEAERSASRQHLLWHTIFNYLHCKNLPAGHLLSWGVRCQVWSCPLVQYHRVYRQWGRCSSSWCRRPIHKGSTDACASVAWRMSYCSAGMRTAVPRTRERRVTVWAPSPSRLTLFVA